MKQYLKMFVPLIILLFSQCDLAKFPIDAKAEVKVDTRLLGKWKIEKKGEIPVKYTIKKQDSMHYTITLKGHKNKKWGTYVAYISHVRNGEFLNIYCKNDTANGYLFLRIIDDSTSRKKIVVTTVSDTTMNNMLSSGMIREHIYNNMDDPGFYKDTAVFKRVW